MLYLAKKDVQGYIANRVPAQIQMELNIPEELFKNKKITEITIPLQLYSHLYSFLLNPLDTNNDLFPRDAIYIATCVEKFTTRPIDCKNSEEDKKFHKLTNSPFKETCYARKICKKDLFPKYGKEEGTLRFISTADTSSEYYKSANKFTEEKLKPFFYRFFKIKDKHNKPALQDIRIKFNKW